MSLPKSLDFYCDLLAQGVESVQAHAFVAAYGTLLKNAGDVQFRDRAVHGAGAPIDELRKADVQGAPGGLTEDISFPIPTPPHARQDHRYIMEWSIRPGDLADIPDPRCVASHLPRGRKPTRDEIDRAIAACRKKTA